MKTKFLTTSIIAIFVVLITSVVYAATGTVELKASTTEIKKGETFTVTLSATSEEGINGINTKYSHSDKLELVSATIGENWSNLGTVPEITVICNSKTKIKTDKIYVLTFKVKENATVGESLAVETTQTTLDTDAQTDSEITISAKKVEVKVIEDKKVTTEKNNTNTETKKDTTTSASKLPQTGISNTVIYILVAITTVCAIICYKKYIEHKDI